MLNNVKVLPARLIGQRLTGGRVELLLERITGLRTIVCQLKSNRTLKIGETLLFEQQAEFRLLTKSGEFFELEYLGNQDLEQLFETIGRIPLPPYISREDDLKDRTTYQTVYAEIKGAVAAPTAGLHFTQELLQSLRSAGVELAFVTLYVGAGTFKPVKTEDPSRHKMHSERIVVNESVCDAVHRCKQAGGRVIAVGTTTVRALESAAQSGTLTPCQKDTALFIRPGYSFKVIDSLITNFHLPKSTLLMMVSAFAGYALTMNAYQHAIQERYRFFSYGDAMLITH